MNRLQYFFFILILGFVASLPIILPYFQKGYFPTHDGEWAVVRAAEMFRELRDLQLPPRFSQALNFGYGYPLFNFAYPGPYYMTTVVHAAGIGFVDSVKIIFALSVPFSFYGMYLFSSAVFKKKLSGMLSAILYLYLPYRMVDLYVRGNIGEAVAMALIPFIFWCLYLLVTSKRKIFYMLLGSLLVFALIISHNIMSVYFGIMFFAFLVSIILSRKIKEVFYVFGTVLWGALMSAYFIVPALFEKQYIKLFLIPIADRNLYFVDIPKLLFSKMGYGTPTESSAFSYQMGIPQLMGFLLSAFSWKQKPTFEKALTISFFTLTIIFVLLMFPFTSVIWNLPLLSEINYPWTLLLPIGFLMSFLSGHVLNIKKGTVIALVIGILAIVLYLPWANPKEVINHGDTYYMTNEGTTTSSQELMPLWVKEYPSVRYVEKVEVLDGSGYTTNVAYDSKKISFVAEMKQPGRVTVNTIYYPGWKAYTGSSEVPIIYDNNRGLIEIELSQGSNTIALHFTETPLRLTADVVSIASFLAFFGTLFAAVVILLQGKPRKNKKIRK